jgi:hypothetical protein
MGEQGNSRECTGSRDHRAEFCEDDRYHKRHQSSEKPSQHAIGACFLRAEIGCEEPT